MSAVVCFGELLVRLAAPGRGLVSQAASLDLHIGGAEANVAVALASLGHDAGVVSILPDNALGTAAIGHLRRYGIDTSAIRTAAGRMGLYFISHGAGARSSEILYDREHSAFAQAGSGDFDWPALLSGARLLHLSGITPALGEQSAKLAIEAADAARTLGIPVSFDGNFRASLWARWNGDPRAILSQLIGRASVLFGNHRDLSLVLGRDIPGDGPDRRRAASEAAFEAFPNLQLIASTARHVVDADTHRISARVDTPQTFAQTEEVIIAGIVDRIGTGDAFAAGVLHGLLSGQSADDMARGGLALAALKHSLAGDASPFGARDIDAFLSGEFDVRR